MLLSVFASMYEALLGTNQDVPNYSDEIFNSVGLLTLIISIGICFIFYVALGRWKAVWYTRTHWFITVFLTAAIGFCFAFFDAKGILGAVDNYLTLFALFNALYAALYFIIFSFLFKMFSIFSKRTPL